jgi:two-component system, chemotaxis family, protein-glutamate methylesterase/glutaminase
VVGTAANGRIALAKLDQNPVDIITLDHEMPELNGIETLREIRKRGLKTRVIMFSSQTVQGAHTALESLRVGADDIVAKPVGASMSLHTAADAIRADLVPKILQFAQGAPQVKTFDSTTLKCVALSALRPSVIVIGSSTGGPTALEKVLSTLKSPLRCPILITQHMPPVFTQTLADRLASISGIPSAEAKQMELLSPNRIYVAPGDYHMSLFNSADGVKIRLTQGSLRNSVRPAVDYLFESAAEIYGNRCLGVVLTGMGEDGLAGAKAIKSAQGAILIQSKESCVVFGMPGAVYSAGAYDKIGDLTEIGETISRLTQT